MRVLVILIFLFFGESLAQRNNRLSFAKLLDENALQRIRSSITTTISSVEDVESTTQDVLIGHERQDCENCLRAHRECKTLLECKICHIPCEVFEEDAIPTTTTTTTTRSTSVETNECKLCLEQNPKCKSAVKCEPCKAPCKITNKDIQASIRAASRCKLCKESVRCRRHAKCDHCKKYCDQSDEETQTTTTTLKTITKSQPELIERRAKIARLVEREEPKTLDEAEKDNSNDSSKEEEEDTDNKNQDDDEEQPTTKQPKKNTTKPSQIKTDLMKSLISNFKPQGDGVAQRNQHKSFDEIESESSESSELESEEIQTTETVVASTTESPSDFVRSLEKGDLKRNESKMFSDVETNNSQENSEEDNVEIEMTTTEHTKTTTEDQSHHIQSLIHHQKHAGIIRFDQRSKSKLSEEVEKDIHEDSEEIVGAAVPLQEDCKPVLIFPSVSSAQDLGKEVLPQTAPRYYPIAAYKSGPRLINLLHLLNVRSRIEDVEKLIVIAKLKSSQPLSENNAPVVIDYSKLIQNIDNQFGNKMDGPSIDLSYEIDKALEMAAEQKKISQGSSALTAKETFKIIQHAIALHNKELSKIVAQTPIIPVEDTEDLIDETTTVSATDTNIDTQTASILAMDPVQEQFANSQGEEMDEDTQTANAIDTKHQPVGMSQKPEGAFQRENEGFIEEILPSTKPDSNELTKHFKERLASSSLVRETSSITPLELKMRRVLEEAERSLTTASIIEEERMPVVSSTTDKMFSSEEDSSSAEVATKINEFEELNIDSRNKGIEVTTSYVPENEKMMNDMKKTIDDRKKALHEATVMGRQNIEDALGKLTELLHTASEEEKLVGAEQETTTVTLDEKDKQSFIEKFTGVIANDLTGNDNLTQAKQEEIREEISKLVKSTVDEAPMQRVSENLDDTNKDLAKIEETVDDTFKSKSKSSEEGDTKRNEDKTGSKELPINKNQEQVGETFMITAEDITTAESITATPKKSLITENPSEDLKQSDLAKSLIEDVTDIPEYIMNKMKNLIKTIPEHRFRVPENRIVESTQNSNHSASLDQSELLLSPSSKPEGQKRKNKEDVFTSEKRTGNQIKESVVGERQQKSDDIDWNLYTTSTSSPTAPWVFPTFEGTTLSINHGRESEDSNGKETEKLGWKDKNKRIKSLSSIKMQEPNVGERQQKFDDNIDWNLYTTSTSSPTAPWVFPTFEGTTLSINHGRESEDSNEEERRKLDWKDKKEHIKSLSSIKMQKPNVGERQQKFDDNIDWNLYTTSTSSPTAPWVFPTFEGTTLSINHGRESEDSTEEEKRKLDWKDKKEHIKSLKSMKMKEPTVGERQQKFDDSIDWNLYTTSTSSPTAPWVFPTFEGTTLSINHGRVSEDFDGTMAQKLKLPSKKRPSSSAEFFSTLDKIKPVSGKASGHRFSVHRPHTAKQIARIKEPTVGQRQQKSDDIDWNLYTTSTTSPTAPWVFPTFEGTTLSISHGKQRDNSDATDVRKMDWTAKGDLNDSSEPYNSIAAAIVPAKDSSNIVHHKFANDLKMLRNAYFNGDISFPIKIKYSPDGSMKFAIDKKKYCNCADSKCSKEDNKESENSGEKVTEVDENFSRNRHGSDEEFEDTPVGMIAPNIFNRNAEVNTEAIQDTASKSIQTNPEIPQPSLDGSPTANEQMQPEVTTNIYNKTDNSMSTEKLLQNSQSADVQMMEESSTRQQSRNWDADNVQHNIEPINDSMRHVQNLQVKRESDYIKKLRERKNRRMAKLEKKKKIVKRSPLLKALGNQEDLCSGNDCQKETQPTKRHLEDKNVVQQSVGFMTDFFSWMKNLTGDKEH